MHIFNFKRFSQHKLEHLYLNPQTGSKRYTIDLENTFLSKFCLNLFVSTILDEVNSQY